MPRQLSSFLVLVGLSLACFAAARAQEPAPKGFSPYALRTCAACPKELAKAPVIFSTADGREFRTCCDACAESFKADPATFTKKIDEAMVKAQLAHYPAIRCLVMPDEELRDPRGPEAMDDENVIVGNRLVRLCCTKCERKLKANPAKYLAELDQAIIAAQTASYPLTICVVSGKPLDGDAASIVVGTRLVKLCCTGCERAIRRDPPSYLSKLDAPAAPPAPAAKP